MTTGTTAGRTETSPLRGAQMANLIVGLIVRAFVISSAIGALIVSVRALL
jgi:hypothetical protein